MVDWVRVRWQLIPIMTSLLFIVYFNNGNYNVYYMGIMIKYHHIKTTNYTKIYFHIIVRVKIILN